MLNQKVRVGFYSALAAMTALAVGAFVFAPLAPRIFGPSYVLTGVILPPLIAAGIPWAVTALLLARSRVLGQTGVTVGITLSFGALGLALVAVGVNQSGLEGAAYGWLIANGIAVVVAVVLTVATHRRPPERDEGRLLTSDVAL